MAACSNPEFDGRTDTIYSLDTPSVTAKAYPGVNVVSWQPVAGANGYKVTVYEEGIFKRSVSGASYLTDTDIVNGKKYTYYVEAESISDPAKWDREVYAKNSRGEASVTAIVPPAGTSALELPAYESGYDGNTKEVKDDKFVVTAENIKISVDKGCVYANIPAKAYLKYTVDIYDTDLSHEIPGINSVDGTSLSDVNSNNVILTKRFQATSGGKYKVVVKVDACNTIYKDSEIEAGEIEIAKLTLDGDGTGKVEANYLSDGKTACIKFTPAKKDGVNVPTSWYKVYRRVVGEYATTQVSGDVKEDVASASKYYVYDEIADTTKTYEYIVVVENDGKYGTAKKTATPLSIDTDLGLSPNTGTPEAKYLPNSNTARISFTPAQKDSVNVPTSWYKVYRRIKDELETTLVSGDVIESVGTTITYYIDDEITDTTKAYQYIVVVEKDGKYGETVTAELSKFSDSFDGNTNSVTAKYMYPVNHFVKDANNAVRITFTPAKKDGEAVPTSEYKVYRNELGNLDQTEITSATNKIMQDKADPNTYVIYDADADKSIDPAKTYVYTVVVVDKDERIVDTETGALSSATKPNITISDSDLSGRSTYNEIEYSFTVETRKNSYAHNSDEDVSKVEVEAYIWVRPATQDFTPAINEIIAKGEKFTPTKDLDWDSSTVYKYKGVKNNLSEGRAYVVVKATCDGYNDTNYTYLSNSGIEIKKPN